jgi:hypothetical protein
MELHVLPKVFHRILLEFVSAEDVLRQNNNRNRLLLARWEEIHG